MVKVSEMKSSINEGTSLEVRHPNAKGTGSALRARLIVGSMPEYRGVLIGIAPQKTVDGFKSSFDFSNPHCAYLGFVEVAQFLQVLRGETESICDGRGIFRKYKECSQRIQLHHVVEPAYGYLFEAFEETTANRGDGRRVRMFLSPAESLGICESIAGSMCLIAFGSPYAAK